jgi:hypothetical protein
LLPSARHSQPLATDSAVEAVNIFIAIQSAITAATPWLASVAGVFALMALAARFIERKPRYGAIAQFRRLGLLWQIKGLPE